MKRLSKQKVEQMQAEGARVRRQPWLKKTNEQAKPLNGEEPEEKAEQTAFKAAAVTMQAAASTMEAIRARLETIEARSTPSYRFTVNRDKNGFIKSVDAVPVK